MNASEKKVLLDLHRLEIELARRHPDLKDRARQYILREAAETPAFRATALGAEPLDVDRVLEEVKCTDLGRLIFSPREETGNTVDHAAAIKDLTPVEQMAYARRNGLK